MSNLQYWCRTGRNAYRPLAKVPLLQQFPFVRCRNSIYDMKGISDTALNLMKGEALNQRLHVTNSGKDLVHGFVT